MANPGSKPLRPAVFLDRDGTVNAEVHYLSQPNQLQLLPTVAETISLLNQKHIAVVIVTNQAAIARGYFPEDRLVEIHRQLRRLLNQKSATVDGVYYCPHHPSAGLGAYKIECECRKPKPGMLFKAAMELNIDLGRSLMIGDRDSDLWAGANAGCRTALVRTGYGEETSVAIDLEKVRGIGVFHTLADAVNSWLTRHNPFSANV